MFNDMKIPVQRFMNSKKILLIINAIIAKCHLSRILKDEIFPTLRYWQIACMFIFCASSYLG